MWTVTKSKSRPAYQISDRIQLPAPRVRQNWYAMQVVGYWEQGLNTMEYNPFTHMWSLGVEEQVMVL